MDPFDLRLWSDFENSGGSPNTPAIVNQIVIDSRRASPSCLFIALKGENQDGHTYIQEAILAGALFVIAKEDYFPSFELPKTCTLLKVKDPLIALQSISKAYRRTKKAKILLISGSYGKTMVKDLLFKFLNGTKKTVSSPESFNSQLGVALSLLTIKNDHEIAIIEAGISKKNEMDRLLEMTEPQSALLTPLGKKHQTTLGNLASSALEWIKICSYPSLDKWLLLPSHTFTKELIEKSNSNLHIHFWNENNPALPFASLNGFSSCSKMKYRIEFPDQTAFEGFAESGFNYFLDLINMAVKAAFLEGVSKNKIVEILKKFILEPMRSEFWQSQTGSIFVNDTYSEDPQSIDLSLKYFNHSTEKNNKTYIFSGMRGNQERLEQDYRRVGLAIAKKKIQKLFLIGNKPYQSLIEEIKKNSSETVISLQPSFEETIKKLQLTLSPNEFVVIKGEKKEPLEKLTEQIDGSLSNNQCTINLKAIESNILAIRKKVGGKKRIMVMVKALAYGTSDVMMAKFLKDFQIDLLGVSYVDEAVTLKKAYVSQEVFVLNASPFEIDKVIKWDLTVGVSDLSFIQELQNKALYQNKKIKVHLHVNTGMNRFGCAPEIALELAKEIKCSSHLILEGMMTHFAAADDEKEDIFTKHQAAIFLKAIREVEQEGIVVPWRHACNSSASIRFDFPEFNMIRIGLAIYGLYPSNAHETYHELKLALSLTSRVVGFNHCKKGDTVSYGRSYVVKDDYQKIAVLPIGYFDGLHRNYSGKGNVIIRGKKAPMVGKICMDYMMVDVTGIENIQIGDKVLIFGEDEYGNYLAPEEFANAGDSIIYELITCLGPRIQRLFIFEEALKLR